MNRLDCFPLPAGPEVLPAVCPCTGLPVRTHPEWSYTNPAKTYRTTFALIGDHIFWVIPRGYIADQDMQQAIALGAAILEETHPAGDPFVFIENFAYSRGGTVGARRLYLQFTNNLPGLLGSFPYGMPPFFRLSFNLSRRLHLHRYRVHMVVRYEEAVSSALAMLQGHRGLPIPDRPAAGSGALDRHPLTGTADSTSGLGVPPDATDALAAHVDDLLTYLGCLDLESPGRPDMSTAAPPSALQPVYDAIEMLKMDMDQFLDEHRELMAVLQDGQHELLERTAAVETSNRELHALLLQGSEDQKDLEKTARRNIRTLLRPLVQQFERESRDAGQRGWVEGLKARIDELEKDLTPDLDLQHYQLTCQETRVARLIRDGARSKVIAEQLGVSVRTVEAFRGRIRAKLGIHGRRRNLRTALLAIPVEQTSGAETRS